MPKILVVDDEENITEILQRTLTNAGYECFAVNTADNALQVVRDEKIDLVISDIRMPDKDGIELLSELVKTPFMAVIMLTAVNDIQTGIQALKLGAYDYILKPFEFNDVLIALERAMQRQDFLKKEATFQTLLKTKVVEQRDKIRKLFMDATTSLINALEVKDGYTRGHSARVTEYACCIAEELGCGASEIEKIRLAAMLHDIGKIGVKETILHKPDKLTPDEYDHISTHTPLGVKIISPIIEDTEVVEAIKYHHEHCDGSGTFGLKFAEIPTFAQIISVADAFDAMTSDRPYRAALPTDTAIEIIRNNIGNQFAKEPAEVLIRCLGHADSGCRVCAVVRETPMN